jgi:enoyl-CoA hydratase/carnithine racemase
VTARKQRRRERQTHGTPIIDQIIELGGAGLDVVDLSRAPAGEPEAESHPGVVRLGVHRGGKAPPGAFEAFDILLSGDPGAPRPWVGMAPGEIDETILELAAAVKRRPIAAAITAQVLRVSLMVSFNEALAAESLAYSMLLASADFQAWREATPRRDRGDADAQRVSLTSEGEALTIRLTRPAARNAVDARMRDALVEALQAAVDLGEGPVVLEGEGPAFSAGGDLDEFGSFADPAQAHMIRMLRSSAALVRKLGDRVTARLHGACVGAGIEIPAAAHHVTARADAQFRLPEVLMGLIPGAGGTATLPRRIGRRRTCFMAISGRFIDPSTALAWGLVDRLEPDP